MMLVDVNVLVYAHREECERHREYRTWLEKTCSEQTIGFSDLVLSGFMRIVTHPRVMNPPSPMAATVAFVETIRSHRNAVVMVPGNRHWGIFMDMVKKGNCRGNLVSDAFHAALAVEAGCEWITTDRDFARFPGLRWRHPLDG